MPGATVFFSGTNLFTACDENGQFHFRELKPGSYQIVVRAIGYQIITKSLNVIDRNINLTLQIFPSTEKLAEVTIKPVKQWYKNLEVFRQQFLGETANAFKCKIQNAEVLSFEVNNATGVFKCSASKPLIIINAALGYKLTYFLTSFVYNQKTNTIGYQGYPYFEEMQGNVEQKQIWVYNRMLTFEGSIHNLICAIYENDLSKRGFSVYKIKNWLPMKTAKTGTAQIYPKLLKAEALLTEKDQLKLLYSEQSVLIVFNKQDEAENYKSENYSLSGMFDNSGLKGYQLSVISFLSPVTIDQLGNYNPPQNLFIEGYMAWEHVGDLMPFGYKNSN